MNWKDADGDTSWLLASQQGNIEIVKLFLDRGAQIDCQVNNSDTSKSRFTALMWASAKGHIEVVKLLLDRGALIDSQDSNGATALMTASMTGKVECVQLLLERGADMSLRMGSTAKDMARREHADIVKLLEEVCAWREDLKITYRLY